MPTDELVPISAGVRLHVRSWPGGGVPYLLVHGLASNARLWDGVAGALSTAGRAAYAVDLRGHGMSSAPPDGYDTPTAAADVRALIDTLGIDPVVVGQSWGGNVALEVPAHALALVDGGWIHLAEEFDSWDACAARLRPPDIDGMAAGDLRAAIRRGHPDWGDWAVDATLANLRIRPDGTVERPLPVDRHMRIVRSMWDRPPDFAAVTGPALLVPAVPADPERARAVRRRVAAAAAALAAAKVVEYVGADHDIHAQHPDRLAADLLEFA